MCRKNGQSIVEYAILLGVVITSLLIMQVYIKRSYQGRIKQEADQVGQQYSPGHTTSVVETNTNSNSTTRSGGVGIPYGMTVTQSATNSTFSKGENVDAFATEK